MPRRTRAIMSNISVTMAAVSATTSFGGVFARNAAVRVGSSPMALAWASSLAR